MNYKNIIKVQNMLNELDMLHSHASAILMDTEEQIKEYLGSQRLKHVNNSDFSLHLTSNEISIEHNLFVAKFSIDEGRYLDVKENHYRQVYRFDIEMGTDDSDKEMWEHFLWFLKHLKSKKQIKVFRLVNTEDDLQRLGFINMKKINKAEVKAIEDMEFSHEFIVDEYFDYEYEKMKK